MKDLKHLLYFENLLQEAHNDLIAQAQNEGKICVAYACENTPEPLLNLPGAFSTRLRAPRTGSMEMATYYMTSFLCEYSRALLERAIEGGYNFADCMITPDGCSMMNRAVENMELLKTMGKSKPKFFYEYMEIPMKADDNGLNLYVLQCRNHILTPLHDVYGIDVSDAAIRKAVAEHNRVCELIRAIGEYRKGANPRITGYEFHVITLATYVAPKYLLIDKLEETLILLLRPHMLGRSSSTIPVTVSCNIYRISGTLRTLLILDQPLTCISSIKGIGSSIDSVNNNRGCLLYTSPSPRDS